MNPLEELLAQLAGIADLNDADLQALLDDIVAEAQAQAQDNPDDATVALIVQAADAADTIRAALADREAQSAARADQQAQALARLAGETAEENDPEPDVEEESSDEDDPEAPEDDPEAEVDEPEADQVVEPIAATSQPVVSRVAARRPAQTQPRTPSAPARMADWNLVASANAPGVRMGTRLNRPEQVADLFGEAIKSCENYQGPKQKLTLASRGWRDGASMYGESRYLDGNVRGNLKKINELVNRQATTYAALQSTGGICAPVPQTYDLPVLGDDGRPVRDRALVRFGADRGGVSTIPPPTITDLAGSVTTWTEANDVTPSSPTTKPCLTVTCPNEDEDLTDAIVSCLRTGNFRARFFPEQLEAWMRLAAVTHARHAETKVLTEIIAGSTHNTSGQVLGTTRDVLTTLDRALADRRYFHRDYTQGYTFVAPYFLFAMIRTDIARQMPVGTLDETLALAEAAVMRWFAVRGITPVWAYEGKTAIMGAFGGPLGDGPIHGYPDTVSTLLYPTGTWLFLDGGSLDLGMVRDSTLNAVNDFQLFSETFEGTHFHGVESQEIIMDVCSDGSASALIDINPCSVGS